MLSLQMSKTISENKTIQLFKAVIEQCKYLRKTLYHEAYVYMECSIFNLKVYKAFFK